MLVLEKLLGTITEVGYPEWKDEWQTNKLNDVINDDYETINEILILFPWLDERVTNVELFNFRYIGLFALSYFKQGVYSCQATFLILYFLIHWLTKSNPVYWCICSLTVQLQLMES